MAERDSHVLAAPVRILESASFNVRIWFHFVGVLSSGEGLFGCGGGWVEVFTSSARARTNSVLLVRYLLFPTT